jgi:hypothetical protein
MEKELRELVELKSWVAATEVGFHYRFDLTQVATCLGKIILRYACGTQDDFSQYPDL